MTGSITVLPLSLLYCSKPWIKIKKAMREYESGQREEMGFDEL
jgi:TusA-related sulfurtransferase